MHGSEKLRGIGSYADVYQAALKTAPSLKAASTAVNAALSLSSTVLHEAANRSDDAMAAAENTLVALKRFRIHLNGDDVGDVDKVRRTDDILFSTHTFSNDRFPFFFVGPR
jgi:hypothetical protein